MYSDSIKICDVVKVYNNGNKDILTMMGSFKDILDYIKDVRKSKHVKTCFCISISPLLDIKKYERWLYEEEPKHIDTFITEDNKTIRYIY